MIRSYTTGDLDYIVESHVRIYKQEYNFDESFQEFISNSVQSFRTDTNSEKGNIWVVDQNGQRKGSIGIVKIDDETAQLRWLLLEPDQRGKGLGKQLIQGAIDFCNDSNYKTFMLRTNNTLHAARNLYGYFGFAITEVKTTYLSKQMIVEEKWELMLKKP